MAKRIGVVVMAVQFAVPRVSKPILRQYSILHGVDFTSDISAVDTSRSPYAVNMVKTYNIGGECVQTRPGFRKLLSLSGRVNGIFFFHMIDGIHVLLHAGTNLYRWTNYPAEPAQTSILRTDMNDHRSRSFAYEGKCYLLDKRNYIVYDGATVQDVEEIAYIPTTSIGRGHTGGGTLLQAVNLLQPKRKNTFSPGGTNKSFQLDAIEIDAAQLSGRNITTGATYNETTDFTVERALGVVTFLTAPAAPEITGTDTIELTFSKTVPGYADRVKQCDICEVFSGRVFFAGNDAYPNWDMHSETNPTYVTDIGYARVGSDGCINGLLTVFDQLIVLTQHKIYTHAQSYDATLGTVFPLKGGADCDGAIAKWGYANFLNDPVFVSSLGVNGVDRLQNANDERYVSHRSSAVDGALVKEELSDTVMLEWSGYLLVMVNGKIYLADSRQTSNIGYEWYYWDNIGVWEGQTQENGVYSGGTFQKASAIAQYESQLYFGTNGAVCKFNTDMVSEAGDELKDTAYNDDGRVLFCRWTTPLDHFGYPSRLKTLNKQGSVLHVKSLLRSSCKIAYSTDKDFQTFLRELDMSRFDFSDINFSNFTFNANAQNDIVWRKKIKNWKRIRFTIYSDTLNTPFGVYSLSVEAALGNYAKR